MSVCLLNPGVVGCGTPKGGIKVIQPRGEVSYSTLNGHSGPVTGIAKLAGARIATCSEDRTVRVFGTRTGVCESTIEQPQGGVPRCVAALPSGQLVIGCEDGNVRVFTPGIGAHPAAPTRPTPPRSTPRRSSAAFFRVYTVPLTPPSPATPVSPHAPHSRKRLDFPRAQRRRAERGRIG